MMKTWSLRSRIAVAYAVLMIACVGAFTAYLVAVAQESYLSTLRQGVEAQARLVAGAARPYLVEPGRRGEIQELAGRLAREARVRVTIIDRSGVVLGDSEQDPGAMENHGSRPEVMAALAIGAGESERRSATVGYDTLYVATPIRDGDRVLGVARVALPLVQVSGAAEGIAWAIVVGGLAATALAVVLALLIARSVTGRIKELTAVAGEMAEGKLDRRVGSHGSGEVGHLARAFDLMAERLRSTIRDISAERNTLSAVLSTMADGILIVDAVGRVTLANRAAGALLGPPAATLEGRSYVEALRDHELSAVVERCLAGGSRESGTVETASPRRFLRIVAAPLRGEQPGALALLQDLTEVRRVATVRRDFIANVSHELRTPLTSLKALVETLEEGAIEEPDLARDFLSRMHTEVDGLAQLVGELLELSRIESGQAPLRLEPLPLKPLVESAMERFQAQAERAGLELSANVPDDLPEAVADGQRVRQVLANLIHNAIKFTPAGGRVGVAARPDAGRILLSVADTGVGIAPADLPRIFERFYKADRSRSGGGTGLGLAIARHIVEAHGGRLWVESVEGQGSTFFFTLPQANPAD